MAILLGYSTALDYWNSVRVDRNKTAQDSMLGTTLERKRTTEFLQANLATYSSRKEAREHLSQIPQHHLVSTLPQLKSWAYFTNHHVASKLPRSSCVRIPDAFAGGQNFVSSPEYSFLQMAKELTLEHLISLGYELCGTYSCSKGETFFNVYPLTTVKKLRHFLFQAKGVAGIKKARRAVQFIADNSASPMETALSMMLHLPYSLGGFGIQKPEHNSRIEIPASFRKKVPHSFFVCDLYWKDSRLAIEYDSDLAHSGIYKTAQDAMRRSILTALDISVLSVTRPQIMDESSMRQLAHLVAAKTQKRLRYHEPEFSRKHRALRKVLLFSDKSEASF